MTADYPDWQTSQDHANKIAGTGVGLLKFANSLGSAVGGTVAAGTFSPIASGLVITQPSWELSLTLNLPAAAGTVPFGRIALTWNDAAGTTLVAQDVATFPCGNGPANAIASCGRGPTKGESLTIGLRNIDPAQVLTYSYEFIDVSHTYLVPQWNQVAPPAVPPIGFTSTGADVGTGITCRTAPLILPTATFTGLIPVFAGKWRCFIDNTGQANACTIKLQTIDGFTTPANTVLYQQQVAAGASAQFEFNSPPMPLLVLLTNNGVAGNITPVFTAIHEPY